VLSAQVLTGGALAIAWGVWPMPCRVVGWTACDPVYRRL